MSSTVNITKAATLAGVTRTTIYKKINNGTLSKLAGGGIDKAELARVFGELKPDIKQGEQKVNTVSRIQNDALLTQEIEYLKKQVASLEKDKDFLQDQLGSALLLEHRPTAEKPEYSEPGVSVQPDRTSEIALKKEIERLERKEPLILKAIKAWRK